MGVNRHFEASWASAYGILVSYPYSYPYCMELSVHFTLGSKSQTSQCLVLTKLTDFLTWQKLTSPTHPVLLFRRRCCMIRLLIAARNIECRLQLHIWTLCSFSMLYCTAVYWHAWFITLFAQTVTRELCKSAIHTLRNKKYRVPFPRTNRFENSFLLYALRNFQWVLLNSLSVICIAYWHLLNV